LPWLLGFDAKNKNPLFTSGQPGTGDLTKGILTMKLPPFEEFILKRADIPVKVYDKFRLPLNPTPDRVVDFAERTAAQTAMTMLEQYHKWLDAWLTTLDNTD